MSKSLRLERLDPRDLFAVHVMSPLILTLPPNLSELQQRQAAIATFAREASVPAGEVDGDGSVDFVDFLHLSRNFGQQDAVRSQGDLDGDGIVSFADFLILSSDFGAIGTSREVLPAANVDKQTFANLVDLAFAADESDSLPKTLTSDGTVQSDEGASCDDEQGHT